MIRYSILLFLAVPLTSLAEPRVAVIGDSLGDARARYAAATSVERRDCDPADGGRWVCASFEDPVPADADGFAPAAPPSDRPPAVGAAVIGDTLADARARYAAATSQPRDDCDPVGDGRWVCASYNDPVLSDLAGAPPPVVVVPGPESPPAPERPPVSSGTARVQAEDLGLSGDWRVEAQREGFTGTGYALWRGNSRNGRPGDGITDIPLTLPVAGEYRLAIRAQAVDAERDGTGNDTFFRFPGGEWTKVFTTGRDAWRVGGTADRGGRRFPFRATLPAGAVTLQMSARSPRHAIDWIELQRVGESEGDPGPGTPDRPGPTGDLIALHYDHSPDWDDAQAVVGARLVLDAYPDRDVLVVNATYADSLADSFIGSSTEHVRTLFPDALDARDGSTRDQAATAWQLTLDNGGTVHVAEGGPSDFTADVLGILQRRGVANLKRVRVVQHSSGAGFNERRTRPANIALVKRVATYVPIANGNGDNATPDFAHNSSAFERRAVASRYGARWRQAFSYIGSDRRVDFSDLVELMHILDLPKSHAPTVDAFADRYFARTASRPEDPAGPPAGPIEPVPGTQLVPTGVTPRRTPGGPGWADSYLGTDGRCWPATTFDHGIGGVRVTTGSGERITIREAVSRLGAGPARRGDLAFNDINCGNGPANDAGDEAVDQCPGLVTRGRAGCELVATALAWWMRL